MGLPVDEQETTINYNRRDDVCEIYTSDSTVMTKLDKLVKNGDYKLIDTQYLDGTLVSKTYECNKKLISFRAKQGKREMTEEQKIATAERMKKAREKSNGENRISET